MRNKPLFLFCQFDSVDHAGHAFGYGSEKHLQRISEVDSLVNDVFDTVKESGMEDDTLFMLIADHGSSRKLHLCVT